MYSPADQKKGLPHLTAVVVGKGPYGLLHEPGRAHRPVVERRPGTVMDRGVTEASNWDFFLPSHASIQGTARSAHFFFLPDEIFRARYAKTLPLPSQNLADVLEAFDVRRLPFHYLVRVDNMLLLQDIAYLDDLVQVGPVSSSIYSFSLGPTTSSTLENW